jgi:GTP cyclohydrolase III
LLLAEGELGFFVKGDNILQACSATANYLQIDHDLEN